MLLVSSLVLLKDKSKFPPVVMVWLREKLNVTVSYLKTVAHESTLAVGFRTKL